MTKIFLYAEILIHLRQLTLYASLQSEKKEKSSIDVSSDKKIITVIHEGESQSIYLPTQISGNAQVIIPLEHGTDISTRLQIDDLEEWNDPNASGIESPWQASDLTNESTLRCLHCKSVILPPGSISTWKDLPSENWEELMDLWFCHKPYEDNEAQESEESKPQDFAARSKISLTQGQGMIDLISFVLHSNDCTNIKATKRETPHQSVKISCQKCETVIGSTDPFADLVRINKSALTVQRTNEMHPEYFPFSIFTCARILSLIDNTAIRKIAVHCNGTKMAITSGNHRPGLLLWVFNPDIYYSSSSHPSTTRTTDTAQVTSFVHRATKIFYHLLPDPVAYVEENSNTVEELILATSEEVTELQETLEHSTSMLPQSARKFQGWDVGLLDRYERNATGQKVMDQNPLTRKGDGPITKVDLPPGFEALYE